MKIVLYFFLLLLSFSACKSEFEAVRTSNDPKKIYKKSLEYYSKGDWEKAKTLFELAIPQYRGKEEAEGLYYKYADTHFQLGEYILAAHYYSNFARTFYNSDKKELAVFQSAYSNYKMSPNYKLDQTYTVKAIDEFQRFINTYPRSEKVAECNNLIDEMRLKLEEKALHQGTLYYDIGHYQAAVKSFESLLLEFPDSKRIEQVRFYMLKSSFKLAQNSVYEKRKERYQNSLEQYNSFIKKHKNSEYASEANEILQEINNEIKKLKS